MNVAIVNLQPAQWEVKGTPACALCANLKSPVVGRGVPFEIVRRRRKTISLRVSPENVVQVLAPRWVLKREILAFVQKNTDWIEKQFLRNSRAQSVKQKLFQTGSQFYVLGEAKVLQISDGLFTALAVDKSRMNVMLRYDEIDRDQVVRSLLSAWYFGQARELLRERVKIFAEKFGRSPTTIRVKQLTSRWGSCSSKGGINLNWRLTQFPLPIVDYVVAHEIAHLFHMNHSTRFWQKLESVMPDYQTRRRELRKLTDTVALL